jgi:hypothetical protein
VLRGRRIALAAAVAVAVSTLVPVTAARAAALPATCSEQGFILNAWAYYTPNGSVRDWNQFQYQLDGHRTGGKSNVNLFVVVDGSGVVYGNESPDRLGSYQLYTVTPPWTVSTPMDDPEYVTYVAYFDRFGGDPYCIAKTSVI